MNKEHKKIIASAKYHAKKWFNNGWSKVVTVHCVDVTFPDGSKELGIKDPEKYNGFDFIYKDSIFASITYNGKKLVTNVT